MATSIPAPGEAASPHYDGPRESLTGGSHQRAVAAFQTFTTACILTIVISETYR